MFKIFFNKQDFINIVCVCKKFKKTTEKLRFNPIPINSLKLFPKIQTQYLYDEHDKKIDGIEKYEIWFNVDYDYYNKNKEDNIKYHRIKYTSGNRLKYGDIIPTRVNSLSSGCYGDELAYIFDGGIENIFSITIPSNITSIKKHCFDSCIDLKSYTLSTKLRTIGSYCFRGCYSLTTIDIPSSVQILRKCCYLNCSKIKTITIPNSIYSIGYNCFAYCTSLQSIIIPTTISILQSTFRECKSLSKVILPTSLISIGKNCFFNCENLKTIELPTSLKLLGNKCFKDCGIKTIELPSSIQSIGVNCFFKTNSRIPIKLKSHANKFTFKVSYNDSILYKLHGITCTNVIFTNEDYKILNNEIQQQNSKEFVLPNGIVKIDKNVFMYSNHLQTIIIPSTVTSIKENCFSHCTSLTSLSIPNSVKSIGIDCFKKCNNLKELSLPLNENNKYPFKVSYKEYFILQRCGIDCEKVVLNDFKYNLIIPTDIPLIVDVFLKTYNYTISNNIISLKKNYLSLDIISITIPTSVTYLCNDCFKEHTKLEAITIPNTIKSLGKHIIDGCSKLTNIEYDGDWNNIIVSYDDHLRYLRNGFVFNSIEYTEKDRKKYGNIIPLKIHLLHNSYYDRLLDMIHIPNHITSLDNKMFASESENYSYLKRIVIPTSIKTIPKYCFSKCYLLTSIELPSTLITIKKKSFSSCISLESITIPSSVITIEEYAFKNCYSLTSITLSTLFPTFGSGCFKGCDKLQDILNIPCHYF